MGLYNNLLTHLNESDKPKKPFVVYSSMRLMVMRLYGDAFGSDSMGKDKIAKDFDTLPEALDYCFENKLEGVGTRNGKFRRALNTNASSKDIERQKREVLKDAKDEGIID